MKLDNLLKLNLNYNLEDEKRVKIFQIQEELFWGALSASKWKLIINMAI